MNKNIKRMFLFTTLLLLILGISAVNAADSSNNTVTNDISTTSDINDVSTTHVTTNDNTKASKIVNANEKVSTDVKTSTKSTAKENKVAKTTKKSEAKTVETSKKVTTEEDKEAETTTSKKVSSNKSSEKTSTKTLKTEDEINYYVSDSTGLDSNDGSIDKPFKTIGHAVELTTDSSTYNIYIKEGTYKGVGNTNLTVPGTNKINFIGDGINKTIFDGEAKFDIQQGGFNWGASEVWWPYINSSGNWFMNITPGDGKITFKDFTMTGGWVTGGSAISLYKIAPVDNYATLSVNNVYFYKNYCGVGTLRNRETGNLIVNNTVFDSNMKSDSTGNEGILYNNGTALVENSIFIGNYARWGSLTNDRILKVNNCTLRDNVGYDGSSTFKFGASIATNTGAADYYNPYGLDGLVTIITNSTFINNDQTDIYQDQGDLEVTNCNFINSTGIYISGKKLNLTVSQNITNNTFDNIVGSALTVSMTSTSKPAIAIRSVAVGYNLTIENNTINAPDLTNGKAMEITGYVNIINNTMNNIINLKGSNCTVTNNTIKTDADYTIIEATTAKNNTYEGNTLYATVLNGDNSLKVGNTAIIKNNKPESKTYVITNENYSDYFDNNGILKSDVVLSGSKIFLSGNFTNKDFIFENINLYVGNNDNVLLTNSSIVSRNNAKIAIEGIKINNIGSKNGYVILFNSTGNQLINSEIKVNTTNKIHAIILADDNNKVQGTTVNITGPSNNINWSQKPQLADTIGLVIISDNNLINASKIYVNAQPNGDTWGTIDGVDIQSTTDALVSSNTIYNTRINVTGNQYAYGLNIQNAKNTTTSLTYSDVKSDNCAYAFQITGIAKDNTIAGYAYANAPNLAYGAYITGMWSGLVNNTNISKLYVQQVTSNEAYGVCLEGITNTIVGNATFKVTGNKTTGLLLNQTANTHIIALTMTTTNTNENSTLISVINANNTNITACKLESNNGHGIILYNNTNTNVTKNVINIKNILCGDAAVEQEITTDNIIFNNTPRSIIISDDTYNNYFNENSTLNVTADIINIGNKLTNKILKMNTNATFYNPYNTTIYNCTFIFVGNNTQSVTLNGLKFENENKAVIMTDLNATMQKTIFFKDGYVKITGDDITAFESNNRCYLSFENSVGILNATNTATFMKYNGTGYTNIQKSNLTIDATNLSKVIQNDNGSIMIGYSNIKQTGNTIVTINGTGLIYKYNNGFSTNNITLTGNNVTAININQYLLDYTTIEKNNFYLTSPNPITAIILNNTGYKSGWSIIGTTIKNNVFIINATNNGIPVISILSGNYNSVTNNYIEALDVYGNKAVSNIGTEATTSNNKPTDGTEFDVLLNITTPEKITVTKSFDINVKVTDNFGNPLTGEITVKVNNDTISTLTESGIVKYTPTTVGKYTITVTYTDENGKYVTKTMNKTVTADKINTIITVNNITGIPHEKVNVPIKLTDEDGNLLTGTVYVLDQYNNTLAIIDVINGEGSFSKTYRTVFNSYLIFIYNGNEIYSNANTTVNLNIAKITTEVTIDPINAQVGDKIDLKAHVVDSEGKFVTAGKVVFKVNGKTLRDVDGNIIYATVNNGIATVENYTVPVSWYNSKAKISVLYGGNNKYEAYRSTDITMNITKRSATMTMTPSTTTPKQGETITLTVKVTDKDTTVNTGRVIFKVNGKTMKNNNGQVIYHDVINGTVTLNYTVPANASPKDYTFTCVYGNNLYERCDVNSTITVVKS